MSGLPTLLSRADIVVSTIDVPSRRIRISDITFHSGRIHIRRHAQGAPEDALSQGLRQASRIGVEMRASTGQSARGIGNQLIPRSVSAGYGNDTQQLGGRRPSTATHTGANDLRATDHQK